jgi:hypothetical protein
MANTSTPFGFQQYRGSGSAPTFEQTQAAILSTNTTAIGFGDPVCQATGTTGLGTGYIIQCPAPTALAVTGQSLSNGVMTETFTALSPALAPPVGAWVVIYGATTAGTVNGPWQILSSSTTTFTHNFSGAVSTGVGTAVVFYPVAGIFAGCTYLSTAQKRRTWSNYWPGSDAAADGIAYLITDPNAQFLVQTANSNTTATAVGLTYIGQNIGHSLGTVNTANGLSATYADQYTLDANFPVGAAGNSFLPFRIVGFPGSPLGVADPLSGANGNDPTTAYNRIVVGFNNSMPRGFAGI